ncbi:MAG: alpha/beta hydrolase [Holophagales bacterium]|nr:alpha/beta hydrolase [Holophagales bacterium]
MGTTPESHPDPSLRDVRSWRQAGSVYRHPTSSAGELEIFYRHEGAGPDLVFLHGFPTSSWDLRELWAELTARFRVLAHDLVGLGYSAKPRAPISVHLQADVVQGLARDRGIGEAHLLAHDLGDTVAQELLARQIEGTAAVRWRSCALLNGGLFPETHRPRPIQKLLASPLGGLVARFTSEGRFRRSLSAVFGPETQPSDAFLRDAWYLLTRDQGRAALPRLIRYIEERSRYRERWVAPLVERTVPTRFLVGALDPVSGRHAAERYRQLVPEPDVVLFDRLGHYPQVEDPASVLAALLDFYAAVEGS